MQTSRPTRWPTWLAAIAPACFVWVIFWPILGFEFTELDVPAQVLRNPYIRGLTGGNLQEIFSTWGNGGTTYSYYPIRTLSYAIDHQFWGLSPAGFKLTNVLIHTANVLLVFWLVLRLFDRMDSAHRTPEPQRDVTVAAFAASLFAIHPAVVEPVAWVAGREELLMVLGALACLHFHVTARRLQERGGATRKAIACYVAAAVCCLAACLSNALAAVIPVLITTWDVLTLARPKWRKILYGTASLWAIGAATIAIKSEGERHDRLAQPMAVDQAEIFSAVMQKLGYHGEVVVAEVGWFTTRRVKLVLNVYWLNIQTLVWPTRLAISYGPIVEGSSFQRGAILGGTAIGLTCVVLWLVRRRRLLLFGLVWFAVALASTSQIMPHHINRADRFLYLPLAGLAVAMAIGLRPLSNVLKRQVAVGGAIAAGVVALLLLGTLSARQVNTWRNGLSLWEHCVSVAPDNDYAHRLLADKLARAGQTERAFSHFKIAARMNVNIDTLSRYGWALATCDDTTQRDYELAIRLGNWACELSQWKDQKVLHRLAVAYNNFAVELSAARQFDRAIDLYHRAYRTDPQYASPRFNLALLLATCGDTRFRRADEAVRLAERAIEVAQHPDANQLMILAVASVEAGQYEKAVVTTDKAIRLAEAEGKAELADLLRQRLKLLQEGVRAESPGD